MQLKATLNRKGSLNVTGDVTAQPLKLGLKVNGNRLDAAAFEPYFGSALNATIASALLNAQGNLTFAQVKGAPRATYRGDVALVDVRMLDKATSDPFAGWRSLALTNLKANYDEKGTDVDAARVTFSNFYGRVLLDAQGRLNLKDVVAKETGPAQSLTRDASKGEPVPLSPGMTPPAAAQAASAAAAQQASVPAAASATVVVKAAPPPQNPVRMHFGELLLQNGRVTYTDNFIKPNYTANLVAIKGTVGAFGTDSTTSAPVDVAANLAGNGPISIKGSVNPLTEKPALDLTATAHDIELTNLTPYSAKYAGYPITKGKLNVDLHYELANDQLKANNHIFIDQLTFGDHVENDTATRLPVKLAISLLKNTRGQIDVNLPVSGPLSNPEFSVGGLIWRAVLNLIAKAVTSPFSLLAHAFGGGGEDLGYVEFAPGPYQLDDAQQKKLDTVVKMLTEKPSIRLDLIGRVDPARDTSGRRRVRRSARAPAEAERRGRAGREHRPDVGEGRAGRVQQVPDARVQGRRLQEAAQRDRPAEDAARRRHEEGARRPCAGRRQRAACARAAARAGRASIPRREDRFEPRVRRRAEARCEGHRGQGRHHPRRLRPAVSEPSAAASVHPFGRGGAFLQRAAIAGSSRLPNSFLAASGRRASSHCASHSTSFAVNTCP